jgi:hypothetical protein
MPVAPHLLLFLGCTIVREGDDASPCKKEEQELQRSMHVSMTDGHNGRIFSVKFFSSWFPELR